MASLFSLGTFYGVDSFFNLLMLIICLIISFQSREIYRLIRDKQYKIFSWAFLSIGISLFFKIIANLTIIHKTVFTNPDLLIIVNQGIEKAQLINLSSMLLYKVFLLFGLFFLFLIFTKTSNKANMILLAYLGLITIFLSLYFNPVFEIAILIILIYLTINFYRNYNKIRSSGSLRVFIAFVFLSLGIIAGTISNFYIWCDILDETLMLTGFLILLINHVKMQNVKKKNKD